MVFPYEIKLEIEESRIGRQIIQKFLRSLESPILQYYDKSQSSWYNENGIKVELCFFLQKIGIL